ncbi:MAG: iron chelate uptake ABC transporter family permease subunit [Corynebacterium sp.]|nr:iron chelate uptake ABC transporter family permease subunit [Corynebacterium sp.]
MNSQWPGVRTVQVGELSFLLRSRVAAVSLALSVVIVAVFAVGIGIGRASVGHSDVWDLLQGAGNSRAELVIVQWRLPRLLLSILVGWCLGVAGAIFQTITRNPLGSPDLIGFTMGAQTGILVSVVVGTSLVGATVAGLIGGVLAGCMIFTFAMLGGFSGMRMILAGIAISAMLGSVNRWLIVRSDADTAYAAMQSVMGTLAAANWEVVRFTLVGMVVVTAIAMFSIRSIRNVELGNDLAFALGANVFKAQAWLVIVGTALVAIATTAAGPIGFVALIAPHLARISCATSSAPIVVAGAYGGVLLLASDLASQAFLGSLPVGIVTSMVGGVYFMVLLFLETRKGRA